LFTWALAREESRRTGNTDDDNETTATMCS
jgi:hypothetical protein